MNDKIKISSYFNDVDLDKFVIEEWFKNFMYFKPLDMRATGYYNGKSRKYDEKVIYSILNAELVKTSKKNLYVADDKNSISMYNGSINKSIVNLDCILEYEIYEEKKSYIHEFLENIISKNKCIVAYACSYEDWFWQNNEDLDAYEIDGRSIENLKVKKDDILPDNDIVDIEYNPGHSHVISGIWFGSCWRMWYGKEYFKYIPMQVLANFKNCYENKQLENNIVEITLYKSPWNYDKEENRDKQWDFRRSVGVDEVASTLENNDKTNTNTNIDAAIEISQGTFEHGGIRLIKYYYNSEGELIEKSKAVQVKTYELGEKGQLIWSVNQKIE